MKTDANNDEAEANSSMSDPNKTRPRSLMLSSF